MARNIVAGLPQGSNGVYASSFAKQGEVVYLLVNRYGDAYDDAY